MFQTAKLSPSRMVVSGFTPQRLQEEVVVGGFQEQEQTESQNSQQRVRYLRKLYFLVFVRLLAVCLLTGLVISSEKFRNWTKETSGFTFWTSLIGCLIAYILVLFQKRIVSSSPTNWVLYFVYVALFSLLFCYFQAQIGHTNQYIHQSFSYLAFTSFFLLIHTISAKHILTFQSATLYIFAAIFLQTILLSIYNLDVTLTQTYFLSVQTIVLSFFLVWETQTIFSQVNDFSREDYVTNSIAVSPYILFLLMGVGNLVKNLLVKARSD